MVAENENNLKTNDIINRLGGFAPPTKFPRSRVSEESMSSINYHNYTHTEYNFNIIWADN